MHEMGVIWGQYVEISVGVHQKVGHVSDKIGRNFEHIKCKYGASWGQMSIFSKTLVT